MRPQRITVLYNRDYDASGAVVSRRTSPFAQTFAMRQATGGRWLNVSVLPLGEGS